VPPRRIPLPKNHNVPLNSQGPSTANHFRASRLRRGNGCLAMFVAPDCLLRVSPQRSAALHLGMLGVDAKLMQDDPAAER
jgi:hypothetical protein